MTIKNHLKIYTLKARRAKFVLCNWLPVFSKCLFLKKYYQNQTFLSLLYSFIFLIYYSDHIFHPSQSKIVKEYNL